MASTLKQHNDVFYKSVTSSKIEHLSPPLQSSHARVILLLSTVQVILGISTIVLGASINEYTKSHGPGMSPHIWWTGLVLVQMGGLGIFVYIVKRSKKAFYWGVLTPVLTVLQAGVMAVYGNFNPGYYGAWPYAGTHKGHPICMYMVSTCYCQDYFHGKLSLVEQPHVQYIHEGSRWKDSGYTSCDDVEHISRLFYSAMLLFAMSVVIAIVACALILYATVWWPRRVHFEKLKNEESHLEECFGPHTSMFSELKDMSHLSS